MNPETRTPGSNRANAKLCAGTAQRQYTATPTRLAPYARAVLDLLRAGKTPNVYLFAGSDAWNQAEHRRRQHGEGTALVLPPEDDPQDFRWPRLDALVAFPGDCDGERFRALVVALLSSGCRCLIEARPGLAPVAHYSNEKNALEAA